jgi:hypothetical protein
VSAHDLRDQVGPTRSRPISLDAKGFKPDGKREVAAGRARIRCPVCTWEPSRRSRWYCAPVGAPEFFFGGCGTAWNTFDTRGRCPGCGYQWRHTACLRCGAYSLHETWYETGTGRDPGD